MSDQDTSLYQKLQNILFNTWLKTKPIGKHIPVDFDMSILDEGVAQIHAAFQDAGYVKVEDDVEVRDNVIRLRDLNLMTGQEWYERFKAELNLYLNDVHGGIMDIYQHEQEPLPILRAMEAAKRAAGLTKETD